jgi:hypothetical protein
MSALLKNQQPEVSLDYSYNGNESPSKPFVVINNSAYTAADVRIESIELGNGTSITFPVVIDQLPIGGLAQIPLSGYDVDDIRMALSKQQPPDEIWAPLALPLRIAYKNSGHTREWVRECQLIFQFKEATSRNLTIRETTPIVLAAQTLGKIDHT